MELISIRPGDVRGGGNIVSPAKTLSDFDVSDSVLTSVSDTVDGKTVSVYNLGYLGGAYFTVTSGHFVVYDDELSSISVTAVLKKHSDDSAITSSSVSCIVNEDTTLTGTTGNDGSVTFTISYDGTVNIFNLRLTYAGTNSIGGCTSYYKVLVGTPTDISLVGSETIIQTDETTVLIATVTGTIDEEENIPLPYQTVNFYEEYEPTTLTIYASPNPIATGETTTISAELKDIDGSKIQGETVDFYTDLPYEPVVTGIVLDADKTIISSYDNEKSVISACVVDQQGFPMGAGLSVTLKKGSTTVYTGETDYRGTVSYEYTASGDGDIVFTAEHSTFSDTITVEDCIFFDSTERNVTTGNDMKKGDVYDSLSLSLPSHFIWSIDMKVSDISGTEDRVFLTPTAFNGEQPTYAIFHQIASSGQSRGGVRNNGNTTDTSSYKTVTADTYAHFEAEQNNGAIDFSVDDTSVGSLTNQSWIDNYDSWWFSYSFWKRPLITSTWKNLKIKKVS